MNSVQSINRAFSVLESVARGSAGLTQVARETELPLSTAARLLATLEELGAVSRADDASYSIGPAIHALGNSDPVAALTARVRPLLERLAADTGETAGVSVRDGHHVAYLDHAEVAREVQVRDWTGEMCPLHTTSSGQVLLAALDDSEIAAYLASPLDTPASRTLATAAEVLDRVATVRRDDYSVTVQEFSDDLASIAVPLRDESGRVVAALHVHGPTYRFPIGAELDAMIAMVSLVAATVDLTTFPRLGTHPGASRD